jgi:hypothetical protein
MKNSMPAFKKPTISSGNYLLEFTETKRTIRLQQALAEEAFGSLTSAQSQQTNLPDTSAAQLPRIIFKSDQKNITISQTNAQLDFNFANSDLDIATQIAILEKNAKEFHSRAVNKFTFANYNLNALILEIQYSSDASVLELQEFIYNKFIKTPLIHPVASAQCAIGYKIANHYVNINAYVYEHRSFEMELNGGNISSALIRQKDTKLIDQGVSFRIDFNNRPISETANFQLTDDSSIIFEIVRSFISNDFYAVTGLNII